MSQQRAAYTATVYTPAPAGARCQLCGQAADVEHQVVQVERREVGGLRLPEMYLCLDRWGCIGRYLGGTRDPRAWQMRLALAALNDEPASALGATQW